MKLKLTKRQVLDIVLKWYLEETPDIFQNEDGDDLEECIEMMISDLSYDKVRKVNPTEHGPKIIE